MVGVKAWRSAIWAPEAFWRRLNQRMFTGTFGHRDAISLRIVLNFVHDVVHQHHAAARSPEQVRRIAGVRNFADVETAAFIFHREDRFFARKLGGNAQQLRLIVLVAVLYRINKSLVESHKKVGSFGTNQAQFGYAIQQIVDHHTHQRKIARQLKVDLFVQPAVRMRLIDDSRFVREVSFQDRPENADRSRQTRAVGSYLKRGDMFTGNI